MLASVRSRATLAAMIVVGAALALGAVGLLGLLGKSLREGVEVSARAQLNDVVALLSLGELPDPLPVTRGDNFTQIVGTTGRILESSPALVGSTPFRNLKPTPGTTLVTEFGSLPDPGGDTVIDTDADGPYLILAETVHPGNRDPETRIDSGLTDPGKLTEPVTVYVAASLASVTTARRTVGLALAGGLPILTVLVGTLVWLFCGRALRPVEAMRSEVDDISERDLHRRVPEPPALDEIGRLARTMNAMLERLEEGAARQRRFVADASHELRSPLTTIQATLEVGLAHPERSAWEVIAADALDESRRLQRLIEDLLTLASADEGALVRREELVDMDELVLAEVARIRQRSQGLQFDLQRVSAGEVSGDRAQLARVVRNLLDNAERHATRVIRVELGTAAGQVTLVVADDGPGLAAADRQRIFERFTRLDEARSADDGGTGLGLSIVAEIIRLHDGTVEMVDAALGARCVITLPAAYDD